MCWSASLRERSAISNSTSSALLNRVDSNPLSVRLAVCLTEWRIGGTVWLLRPAAWSGAFNGTTFEDCVTACVSHIYAPLCSELQHWCTRRGGMRVVKSLRLPSQNPGARLARCWSSVGV